MTKRTIEITFPLDSIGLIVWIIFMVLWYGTGTLNASNFHIFWVWFPLWAPIALDLIIGISLSIFYIKYLE